MGFEVSVASTTEWKEWLDSSNERCVYANARLKNGLAVDGSLLRAAYSAAERRKVYLMQRRVDGGFDYLAVKPSEDRLVSVKFAPLPLFKGSK